MEPWRTILLVATVAGFLVTVGGLVAAYRGARDEYADAGRRIETMRRLGAEEQAEHEAVGGDPNRDEQNEAIHSNYGRIYAEHDLVRPSYENIVYLSQHESQRLLGMVLSSTRRDFLVAAIGLLVSTAASVGSLYLSGS